MVLLQYMFIIEVTVGGGVLLGYWVRGFAQYNWTLA